MARHSHWHNIQITKGKADKKKAAVFGKLARAITVAAREGGGDPSFNVRLRVAVESAKAESMPKDNIERAILRGTGGGDGAALEEVAYEAYAPGRIAAVIVATTDNRNRTAGEVKALVSKLGGSMANPGAFSYLFDRRAVITITKDSVKDRDAFDLAMIDAGAEDIEDDGEMLRVLGSPKSLAQLATAAATASIGSTGIEYLPKETVPVQDPASLEEFIATLSNLDDVDDVFVNAA